VVPDNGTTITFRVTPTGNVDYDASLDDRLAGRGTSTLLLHDSKNMDIFALIRKMLN
jgi:hypothetical protein